MIFLVGMHELCHAAKVPAAFVSVHRLSRRRRSSFPVRRWVMDSGAFRTIEIHGGYPQPIEAYARLIRKFANNGRLLAAVSQDYMCEPFMLKRTGLTIADHQRLTIERYDALKACDTKGVYILPVLQGYGPGDYVAHVRQYGSRLGNRAWVGVGSVCKRNSNPRSVLQVLEAIKAERPDLRLHAFGLKTTALQWSRVRDLLFSADSMAWSYSARKQGRKSSDPQEAIAFARRITKIRNPSPLPLLAI